MESLSGKAVVVTGGAKGLGRAVVKACIDEGAKCVFIDVDKESGSELSVELGSSAIFVCGSVCSSEIVETAFKKCAEAFGGVDVLVNNAGIIDFQNWERVMENNLMAPIRCTKMALQHLRPGGAVIQVASDAGLFYYPDNGIYSVSKAGLVTYTRLFAEADSEAAARNVRVSAICPGLMKTPLVDTIRRDDNAKLFAQLEMFKDSGMEPEEVAAAVVHMIKKVDSGSVWAILGKGQGLMRVPNVNTRENLVPLLKKE